MACVAPPSQSAKTRMSATSRVRENYIACNMFTRSELVVLIRRGTHILGQIDIDSDVVDPFTAMKNGAVRQVADALAVLL